MAAAAPVQAIVTLDMISAFYSLVASLVAAPPHAGRAGSRAWLRC